MSTPGAGTLRRRLHAALGAHAGLLDALIEEAEARGASAYLVGGPVRDLLLGLPLVDLDVLLSDRHEEIARGLAERLGARLVLHPRFLTASVEGAAFRIDLARARRERYSSPGALPRVQPARVEDDLGRRDFSIHAMALPLRTVWGDQLLDPHGGCPDLERRRLRVLHESSFMDDPTRLFRAARYAARLSLRLDPASASLATAALRSRALDRVSGTRILHELERALLEADPAAAVSRTARLSLFGAISSGWSPRPVVARGLRRLARARQDPPWPEAGTSEVSSAAGLRLLLAGLPRRVRVRSVARLGLQGRRAAALEGDLESLPRLERALSRGLTPGELDQRLGGVAEAGLLLLFCASAAAAQRRVVRYARVLRNESSPFDGHRARALGARGPVVGALLAAARARALDGRPTDERWARAWLARRRKMG